MPISKKFSVLAAGLLLMLFLLPVSVCAASYQDMPPGTYPVDTELSCYINAMGGVEFGKPLLKSAQLTVQADGSKRMTLFFGKSSVNIYGVVCDTFIDATPAEAVTDGSVAAGTLGYYSANGNLVQSGVSHTLSQDTVENSRQEQVSYVASMTFPLEQQQDTYQLAVYINSNVMGTQFSRDKYPASLTVNWDSVLSSTDAGSSGVPSVSASPEGNQDVPVKNNADIAEQPQDHNAEATSGNKEPHVEEAQGQDGSQEPSASLVEKMDGLNIYRPDKNQDGSSTDDAPLTESEPEPVEGTSSGYTAYFDKTILIIIGSVGTTLIVVGTLLVILSRKEKKE